MQIASKLAGLSLMDAGVLRKAFATKKTEDMAKQGKEFIQGCVRNGIKEPTAAKIMDMVERFTSYTFNKSHSAAYALISYRCAYLKANFPKEFMAARREE